MNQLRNSFSKQALAVPALENDDSICLRILPVFPPHPFSFANDSGTFGTEQAPPRWKKTYDKVTHQLLILVHLFSLCFENTKKRLFFLFQCDSL